MDLTPPNPHHLFFIVNMHVALGGHGEQHPACPCSRNRPPGHAPALRFRPLPSKAIPAAPGPVLGALCASLMDPPHPNVWSLASWAVGEDPGVAP